MSGYKVVEVVEQEGTFDGKWALPFRAGLLIQMVNYLAASDCVEINEMENPKRILVRVTIETKEV